jgi:DNA-binding Lrp family transcriptional regulator
MPTQQSSPRRPLDQIDVALLNELESNGRMAVSELAQRVRIAESTCHKRLRALIDAGVIIGFRADVDPAALGLQLEALISIRIHSHARNTLRRFQGFLEHLPETRHVYFMSGERDFLVHVAVRDTAELRALVSDRISLREEVAATNTSLIFDHAPRRSNKRRS